MILSGAAAAREREATGGGKQPKMIANEVRIFTRYGTTLVRYIKYYWISDAKSILKPRP
jgi:hypothetical protein